MIYIIAAVAKNNVIGKNGGMPWHIPEDLKNFRELTMGSAVVMGRITYESIGHPLPGRLNIVVSNSQEFQGENLTTAHSLYHAIKLAGDRDVFVSGGRQLYKEAIEIADILYITEIDMEAEGDTFFPGFDCSLFDRTVVGTFDLPVRYSYVTYVRKK